MPRGPAKKIFDAHLKAHKFIFYVLAFWCFFHTGGHIFNFTSLYSNRSLSFNVIRHRLLPIVYYTYSVFPVGYITISNKNETIIEQIIGPYNSTDAINPIQDAEDLLDFFRIALSTRAGWSGILLFLELVIRVYISILV